MSPKESPFWKGKNVLVTGGTGFIGSHIAAQLLQVGAHVRVTGHEGGRAKRHVSDEGKVDLLVGDLRESTFCRTICQGMDVVIHAAAHVGGIQYNEKHSAAIFHDNTLMITHLLDAIRASRVDRSVIVSSTSVYAPTSPIPASEEEGLSGQLEPKTQGYAWSKRFAEVIAQSYAEEFDMKIGIVRPCQAYGPGDHFGDEDAHVITALIDRLLSGQNPFVVWGNGEQKRQFIYVSDLALGVMACAEHYPTADPVNLGNNEEIRIADLVTQLQELSGLHPKISFDLSKPGGRLRAAYDYRKAQEKLHFSSDIALIDGLKRTLDWHRSHILKATV